MRPRNMKIILLKISRVLEMHYVVNFKLILYWEMKAMRSQAGIHTATNICVLSIWTLKIHGYRHCRNITV